MNKFNEQFLSDRYSKLITESPLASLDIFDFECDNGWLGLIDATLALIQKHSINNDCSVKLTQVKEKFGGLRIYYHGGDECIRAIVDIAELVSGQVCEVCGRSGQVSQAKGWISIRCDEHRLAFLSRPTITPLAFQKYSLQYSTTVAAAISLFADKTVAWIKSPAPALSGNRPYELLNDADGCVEVFRLIKQLEHGVYI